MTPDQYAKDIVDTECLALRIEPYMPRRSKFRCWAKRLFDGNLPAKRYVQLRVRLLKFDSQ